MSNARNISLKSASSFIKHICFYRGHYSCTSKHTLNLFKSKNVQNVFETANFFLKMNILVHSGTSFWNILDISETTLNSILDVLDCAWNILKMTHCANHSTMPLQAWRALSLESICWHFLIDGMNMYDCSAVSIPCNIGMAPPWKMIEVRLCQKLARLHLHIAHSTGYWVTTKLMLWWW